MLAHCDARIDGPLVASEAVRAGLGHFAEEAAQECELFGADLTGWYSERSLVVVLNASGEFAIPQARDGCARGQASRSADASVQFGAYSAMKSGGQRDESQASWRRRSNRHTEIDRYIGSVNA